MAQDMLEKKKELILSHEKAYGAGLARRVLDKPVPPIWMILIPIFFIFFAIKMKQYKEGVQKFTDNYLIAPKRALDTAFWAVRTGQEPNKDEIMKQAEAVPEAARPEYRKWMHLLIDHYLHLLEASGDTAPRLIRAHYRNKTNYLLFIRTLCEAEHAFNLKLLPNIEGDRQDISATVERMLHGGTELRRTEADVIFK